MSWNLTDIKYGWKILAGIALTGTTIFVADNIIQRIYQRDVIQIILGTFERCLATQTNQYDTNPPAYQILLPFFARSWYSNSYGTTNVPGDLVTNWYTVLHTNIFTNVIGWRTDRQMMVELDAKMKELPPYYTTNSPGRYTSSVSTLTVTGIFASLEIGDKTNQFTRVPARGTNVATYGDYPWRIYALDLEERYKFLYYLKNTVTSWTPDQIYGGTDNVTSGKRWVVDVTYLCGSVWTDENSFDLAEGTNNRVLNELPSAPTSADFLGWAMEGWGDNANNVYIIDEEWSNDFPYGTNGATITIYFYQYCRYNASTNTTVGAQKKYSESLWEPILEEMYIGDPVYDWFKSWRGGGNAHINAGTFYNQSYYTNLTTLAESTNMFNGEVNVIITGDDGGGAIPLEVTDDDGSAGFWPDKGTNDSPFLAYSNSFKSLLVVAAGDLNVPNILGQKIYSFSISQGPIKDIVASGAEYGVTNLHFQDLSSNWYEKFSYCTNKYW